LTFPETEKDWEEQKAWYAAQGLNYEELCKIDLEARKADLLKYLPASFHPYIHDGTLNSTFPSEELRNMADQWNSAFEARSKALRDAYWSHYQAIQNALPRNVIRLAEKSLHDAKVASVERPSRETFIMTLDCSGSFYDPSLLRLIFKGVINVQPAAIHAGSWWLYEEVYLTENGFEFHILFDQPLQEFTISAADVDIEL